MPILGGCCCFDLKVGTKIIGILNLICSSVSLLMTVIMLAVSSVIEEFIQDEARDQKARNHMLASTPEHPKRAGHSHDEQDSLTPFNRQQLGELFKWFHDNPSFFRYALFVCLGLIIIDIIVASLLITALKKNRRGFMLPWIVFHCLTLILGFLAFVAGITLYIVYLGPHMVFIIVEVITVTISMGVQVYVNLVVISQYQAMGLILLHNEEMMMK